MPIANSIIAIFAHARNVRRRIWLVGLVLPLLCAGCSSSDEDSYVESMAKSMVNKAVEEAKEEAKAAAKKEINALKNETQKSLDSMKEELVLSQQSKKQVDEYFEYGVGFVRWCMTIVSCLFVFHIVRRAATLFWLDRVSDKPSTFLPQRAAKHEGS